MKNGRMDEKRTCKVRKKNIYNYIKIFIRGITEKRMIRKNNNIAEKK